MTYQSKAVTIALLVTLLGCDQAIIEDYTEGAIGGLVVDKEGGEPVASARISVMSRLSTADDSSLSPFYADSKHTDELGQYKFRWREITSISGQMVIHLSVEKSGYLPADTVSVITIEGLSKDNDVEINLQLKESRLSPVHKSRNRPG